jgi:hypothetical protein
LQPEGAGRLADQIDSEIRYELFDEDRKNQLTPGLTILQSSLSLRAPKNQSKVLKYWATGPALTGLFLWDASRDFPAITGPPAMQVHVRCNPPLNARAIAIRMQAPMKPAIK